MPGHLDLAERVLAPLWRGLVGYRALAFGYACVLTAAGWDGYQRPALTAAVLGAVGLWTVATSPRYLRSGPVPAGLVLADLALTVVAVAATVLVLPAERIEAGAPVLTSIWSASAPVAMALARGPVLGLLGALLVQATVLAVRGGLGTAEVTDLLLLVAATVALGYAAHVSRRSAAELRAAIELRAALAERERLARDIHDGVLQVLAQVRRRGRAAGGPAAELGELAGQQEVALRALVSSGPPRLLPAGRSDLVPALTAFASASVTVSGPGHPVVLPTHTAAELAAAVRAALANVAEHVGADAPAWVLLEDLGERVLVSVRDDGPGIPDGRLVAAEAAGRLGVAGSIRGRIEQIGGTAVCDTGPGTGTEWTFEVAR